MARRIGPNYIANDNALSALAQTFVPQALYDLPQATLEKERSRRLSEATSSVVDMERIAGVNVDVVEAVCAAGKAAGADLAAATGAARK